MPSRPMVLSKLPSISLVRDFRCSMKSRSAFHRRSPPPRPRQKSEAWILPIAPSSTSTSPRWSLIRWLILERRSGVNSLATARSDSAAILFQASNTRRALSAGAGAEGAGDALSDGLGGSELNSVVGLDWIDPVPSPSKERISAGEASPNGSRGLVEFFRPMSLNSIATDPSSFGFGNLNDGLSIFWCFQPVMWKYCFPSMA